MPSQRRKAGPQEFARVGWLPNDPRARRNGAASTTIYSKAKAVKALDVLSDPSLTVADQMALIQAWADRLQASLEASQIVERAP